jgi:hypothetical protein
VLFIIIKLNIFLLNKVQKILHSGGGANSGRFAIFDGFSGLVNIGHDSSLKTAHFTHSCWIRLSATQISRGIIADWRNYTGSIIGISDSEYNKIKFHLYNPANVLYSGTLNNNKSYMVTGTWDGTTAKLYINDPQLTTKENPMSKLKWENPTLNQFDVKKTSGACNNGSGRFLQACISGIGTIECGTGASALDNLTACSYGGAALSCNAGGLYAFLIS